ncbi:hypothetical protein D9M68_542590 [compost metagenome]
MAAMPRLREAMSSSVPTRPRQLMPSSSIFFCASGVGAAKALMAPFRAVVAWGVRIPEMVIRAMAADTSSKPTPAARAVGSTSPMNLASSGNVVTPSRTARNIWS